MNPPKISDDNEDFFDEQDWFEFSDEDELDLINGEEEEEFE